MTTKKIQILDSLNKNVVLYTPQKLTEKEKLQARENINAASLDEVYTKSEVYTKTEVDDVVNSIDLSDYYTKSEIYSKSEIDNGHYTKSEVYNKTEVDNELANYYTSAETDTRLGTKADLVGGKVPTSQLPDDVVNHKQIQADYAQSDSSKSDYIKNKPTKVSEFTNDASYQTAQQVTDTLASYSTTQQMNSALAGKSDTGHNHNISDLTGVASVARGGTGYSSIVDTTYTTSRYRASSLHSADTTPGSNGTITWKYE